MKSISEAALLVAQRLMLVSSHLQVDLQGNSKRLELVLNLLPPGGLSFTAFIVFWKFVSRNLTDFTKEP